MTKLVPASGMKRTPASQSSPLRAPKNASSVLLQDAQIEAPPQAGNVFRRYANTYHITIEDDIDSLCHHGHDIGDAITNAGTGTTAYH